MPKNNENRGRQKTLINSPSITEMQNLKLIELELKELEKEKEESTINE